MDTTPSSGRPGSPGPPEKFGTFGLSYPAAVQWLAAIEQPPHLRAMVPAMTFSTPERFFYFNGVFDLSWLPWIHNSIAPDTRDRRGLPGPTTGDEARAPGGKTESECGASCRCSNYQI